MTANLPAHAPDFDEVAGAVQKLGYSSADCERLIQGVDEKTVSREPILNLRSALRDSGVSCESDQLERVLLSHAAAASRPRIPALRIYEPVKRLIEREFRLYSEPLHGPHPPLDAATQPFVAAAKIATLRRFPAGPIDWEIEGLRRSALLDVCTRDLPRALYWIAFRFGGFSPAFFMHVAVRPRNRGLILEREVRLAYYRIARSLALQPEMRGLLTEAWFHDPAAVKDNPHLAALSEPFTQHGGCIVMLGPATPESGVLERNSERKRAFESGELRYRLGLGMWPRDAAIAWAQAHPEFEALG